MSELLRLFGSDFPTEMEKATAGTGKKITDRLHCAVAVVTQGINQKIIVINLVPDKLDPLVANELKLLKLKPNVIVPQDKALCRYDLEQKPLNEMPDNSPAIQAVARLMNNL